MATYVGLQTKLTEQLLDQIFYSQQVHFQFHTLAGNCHNRMLRFLYKSPPDQGICFRVLMDLKAEILCLFGKQFLVSEITVKYVILKKVTFFNMAFDPCVILDLTTQAII